MKKLTFGGNLNLYIPEQGESITPESFEDNQDGITKEDFFKVLDKASQPIKRKPKSGSKPS